MSLMKEGSRVGTLSSCIGCLRCAEYLFDLSMNLFAVFVHWKMSTAS